MATPNDNYLAVAYTVRDRILSMWAKKAYTYYAQASRTCLRPAQWQRMSILSVARMGAFSSDRAIREYGDRIWQICPVEIDG